MVQRALDTVSFPGIRNLRIYPIFLYSFAEKKEISMVILSKKDR